MFFLCALDKPYLFLNPNVLNVTNTGSMSTLGEAANIRLMSFWSKTIKFRSINLSKAQLNLWIYVWMQHEGSPISLHHMSWCSGHVLKYIELFCLAIKIDLILNSNLTIRIIKCKNRNEINCVCWLNIRRLIVLYPALFNIYFLAHFMTLSIC